MKHKIHFTHIMLFAILMTTLTYCATGANTTPHAPGQAPTLSNIFGFETVTASLPEMEGANPFPAAPTNEGSEGETTEATAGGATITINASGAETPINACLLGTNLPAWLGEYRFSDATVQARTIHSGVSLVRLPGGSWSNWYPWADCEQDNNSVCDSWIADPTDFINFLKDTGLPGMWTVNHNTTSKEAAALVAFMNGQVGDTRVIGVDVRGKNWGTVGQWAQLRASHGNPEPVGLQYWEIGNEIYGGRPGMGTDCLAWGWEDVWTCDGTEYVQGIGSGANRHEGFFEFREAMRFVDPSVQVGAVGVYPQDSWTNWGNEVIAAAGDVMDFYIIHQYAFFEPPANMQQALAQPIGIWEDMMQDVKASFAQHAGGRDVPIAITEHNLFSVQDLDNNQWMTRAVNALFMADTYGQMMLHGFDIANQWDLMNGQAGNGTDYGLMHADSYSRYPQYYVFPMWARFGDTMLPVTNSENPATTLSVYAGQVDANTLSLLAINKTGNPISANISINGVSGVTGGLIDVVAAQSLNSTSVTFNGSNNPSNDLSNAPSSSLTDLSLPVSHSFPPYSITLIRLDVSGSPAAPGGALFALGGGQEVFLPVVMNGNGTPGPAPVVCGE